MHRNKLTKTITKPNELKRDLRKFCIVLQENVECKKHKIQNCKAMNSLDYEN